MGREGVTMILKDRLLNCLKESPKTNNELRVLVPDKNMRIIAATISANLDVFLRLEKGYVGLKNRDEHLITGRPIKANKFCLYKKMVNLVMHRPRTIQELYDALPNEKQVSIRATVNMKPEFFVRIKDGLIGRTGRDEYLIEQYQVVKPAKVKRRTITDDLSVLLLDGDKHIDEICKSLPQHLRKSITSRLSKIPKFERKESCVWGLKK
jgi:hypothetical protein